VKTYRFDVDPMAWARARYDSRSRRFFTDTGTKAYKLTLGYQARMQHATEPMSGPLKLILKFYLKPPQRTKLKHPAVRPDIDNYAKAVMDALNGIVWMDDSQVCVIEAVKIYDWVDRRGRIEMEVHEMGVPNE
jgi:Holliday junction resolvase RusA-like endonuclease